MITPQLKSKIERIVNVFETGKPEGHYDAITKYRDYRNPTTGVYQVQVTYGRSQTTEFGNLKTLVQKYIDRNGQYANELKPFLNKIGKQPSLASNVAFCNALVKAGKDPIMQAAQDDLFDSYYFLPALGWFNQMGFTTPLALLVIYDSFIHSGGILDFLRKRFPAAPPVKGGDEKEWIKQYVNARGQWLKTHPNKILQNTVYRTNTFLNQVKSNNWDLSQPVIANGVKVV